MAPLGLRTARWTIHPHRQTDRRFDNRWPNLTKGGPVPSTRLPPQLENSKLRHRRLNLETKCQTMPSDENFQSDSGLEAALQMRARFANDGPSPETTKPLFGLGSGDLPQEPPFQPLAARGQKQQAVGSPPFRRADPRGVESRIGDILKQNAQRHRRSCLWKTDSGGRQGCDRCWPCRGHLSFSLYAILFTDTCIPHTTEAAAIHAFPLY